MKKYTLWRKWSGPVLLACIAGSASVSALASEKAVSPKKETKTWAQKMRGLEQTLQELLIDLNSDERYNSPKNFKRIEKNVEKFANLAHELKAEEGASPDRDATIQIIAGQFSKEADHAYKTLKWGHRAYARGVLKSMTGYCIACHTRNGSGPSFQSASLSPAIRSLKTLERADYFASTRQFDQALESYGKIVADPSGPENRHFDWERAIRSSLAIAVRVKKDPDRALEIVNRVLAAPKAAYFLKEEASAWKKSLLAWKEEGAAKPQTEEGYYAQAVKLIAEAKSAQKYPADRSADMLYLRASSAVHDLLSFAPQGVHATDALFLAGLCYEVLNDLNLWDQHEFYYLACILKSPRTEISQQCFKHYEQSIYLGYTGSGGTHLPKEIRERLKELEQLSMPVTENPVPKKMQ